MDDALTHTGGYTEDEQNQRLAAAIRQERRRLYRFIRARVPDPGDAEDILQEVFYELTMAYRLLKPVEQVSAWLFRVARNRITDLFRKKRPEPFSSMAPAGTGDKDEADEPRLEDLLPSPDAGPDALYARQILLDELTEALNELPDEQREVLLAHEWDGRTFKELAAETGVSINTLLSRKRYAMRHLRERLQAIHEEFNT